MLCRRFTRSFSDVAVHKACFMQCPCQSIVLSTPARSSSSTSGDTTQTSKGTIDDNEMNVFNRLAHTWWNEQGELASLHTFNQLRVPWIRDTMSTQLKSRDTSQPLRSLNIIDVGCGGGILTEPLARLGANVTGLDANAEAVTVAKQHKRRDSSLGDNLQYEQCDVEDLVSSRHGHFDALVASEVIEHVTHKGAFVEACCKLVKPGGSLFFTTLNKTLISYALAVVAAERVAGIVPPGTHDHDKFISPQDLKLLLEKNGCSTLLIHGLWMNPISYRWSWAQRTEINYALHAVKT